MYIVIIRYPGSNCDIDTLRFFSDDKNKAVFLWHTESSLDSIGLDWSQIDLLIIPGGFAFGDRFYNKATEEYSVCPGKMALDSPATSLIVEASLRKIPILGICNGFQILTQLKLLPGKLELNNTKKFICKRVKCLSKFMNNSESDMYIANSYGRYIQPINKEVKVFLEYSDKLEEYDNKIAGVCNDEMNIFGMMPHPERNNSNFECDLYKLLFPDKLYRHTYYDFENRINELMNSEHISYKTTRRYLKKLHTKEDWVIQGPGENAGIVDIGDGYCIALRIESHNHPTYINPFEGAATGVGGILRDIFTMGARPIAILDFLRFGTDKNSESLLDKAIEGISYYGNCIGVPNIGGDLYTCSTYNKNPLVNVAAIGIVKKENIIYGSVKNVGDLLVYIGSKTGNEGIGGAAMASKSFSENDNSNWDELQKNVQKSDPYLENLLLEACIEIANKKYATGMQDMGAGGLLCASIELIRRGRDLIKKEMLLPFHLSSNFGCKINLDLVPTKNAMKPCDILSSESQERMLLVISPENRQVVSNILDKWDLEYHVVGEVTKNGFYEVYSKNEMIYRKSFESFNEIDDYTYNPTCELFKTVKPANKIKSPDRWRVYDSTVGNRTIKGPDKPGSYAIVDIFEVKKSLFLTWGETFDECYNQMTMFEDVKPLCIVNCLNFGHPKDSMSDFSYTINNLRKRCMETCIPVVGGNVSLYNSSDENSIRPTPILLMVGISS